MRIFKKSIKIRSVQFEIQGGDKHRHHDALGTPPSPPQTRSTSFRSARFASLATRVIMCLCKTHEDEIISKKEQNIIYDLQLSAKKQNVKRFKTDEAISA